MSDPYDWEKDDKEILDRFTSPLYDTREEEELDDEINGTGRFAPAEGGHTHLCLCGITWEHSTMLSQSDCEETIIGWCPVCEEEKDYPTYREQEGRF